MSDDVVDCHGFVQPVHLETIVPVASANQQTSIMGHGEQFGLHLQTWGERATYPPFGSGKKKKLLWKMLSTALTYDRH